MFEGCQKTLNCMIYAIKPSSDWIGTEVAIYFEPLCYVSIQAVVRGAWSFLWSSLASTKLDEEQPWPSY